MLGSDVTNGSMGAYTGTIMTMISGMCDHTYTKKQMGKAGRWMLGVLVGVYRIADSHNVMPNRISGTWDE